MTQTRTKNKDVGQYGPELGIDGNYSTCVWVELVDDSRWTVDLCLTYVITEVAIRPFPHGNSFSCLTL